MIHNFGNWACRAASLAPVHAINYTRDPACLLECPSSLISLISQPSWRPLALTLGHGAQRAPIPGAPSLKASGKRCTKQINKMMIEGVGSLWNGWIQAPQEHPFHKIHHNMPSEKCLTVSAEGLSTPFPGCTTFNLINLIFEITVIFNNFYNLS